MASFNTPRLITPPREEEEVYPYRRVWRSIIIEMSILSSLAIVLVLLQLLNIAVPTPIQVPANVVLVLVPIVLWIAFSYFPERAALLPRSSIVTVVIVSALAANAVGIPIIDQVMRVNMWLPQASTVDRIIGYTVTVGIVHELLKYLIIRYLVWPNLLRIRLDVVAYGAACAVGYATVINLNYVLENTSLPSIVALRVLGTVGMHMVGSVVVSYGLAELWFSRANLFLLPFTFIIASTSMGLAITMQAALMNAPLSTSISSTRPIFALGFLVVFIGFSLLVAAFLFNVSESRSEAVDTE